MTGHIALGSRLVLLLSTAFALVAPARAAVTVAGLDNDSSSIVVDNGILRAVFLRDNAGLSSLKLHGTELLAQTGNHKGLYHSWDNGAFYNPGACKVKAVTRTSNLVDLSFTWSSAAARTHMDMDIHFSLATGDSALYAWSVMDHPASYDTLDVGFWLAMVWNANDGTEFTMENVYVDSLRKGLQPTYADLQTSSSTGIAEIIKLTQGKFAGQYNGKYEYSADLWTLSAFGHASDRNRIGLFAVYPAHEWLGYGPDQQDLNATADAIHVIHSAGHYNGPGYRILPGRSYHKVFGPYLLYGNSGKSADSLWLDAKARAVSDGRKWPFSWVTDTGYHISDRGKVAGRIQVKDSLKPAVTGAGFWVGLAQFDTAVDPVGTDPTFQGRGYQYWVRADASGNFVLYNVRPGTYSLYSWGSGALGQFRKDSVTVTASGVTSVGILHWNIPRTNGKLAWEIGVPDRKSAEFVGSSNFFKGFNWKDFPSQFSNPLVFTVGTSDWKTALNYAQSAWWIDDSTWQTWPWEFHFRTDSVKASDTALLTLSLASANYARLDISLDGALLERYYPVVTGGNALIRQSDHAKNDIHLVRIPTAKLAAGSHVLTLTQGRACSGCHVMYDYLSLEVPQAAAAPVGVTGARHKATTLTRTGSILRIEGESAWRLQVADLSGRIVLDARGESDATLRLPDGHAMLAGRLSHNGSSSEVLLGP